MNDEKKSRVTRLDARRNKTLSTAVTAAIMKDQPTVGGGQGDYVRPKCGGCLSWRRQPTAGQGAMPLNMGVCMFAPPVPHPVMDDQGRMVAQALMRPMLTSDAEGCDQFDDGTDDEEGDSEGHPEEPREVSSILKVG